MRVEPSLEAATAEALPAPGGGTPTEGYIVKLTTAGRFLLEHRRRATDGWTTLFHVGRREVLVKLLDRIVMPGELRIREARATSGIPRPRRQTE